MHPGDSRSGLGWLLWAVGLRVLVWGGLTGAAIVYLVDLPPLPTTAPPVATEDLAEMAEGPGWPHWRGPRYDAHSDETDLADAWPPEGPPVLWTRELGRGYSAIIAVGPRVYTQRQTLTDQSVLCLDADTGSTVWEYRYGWPYEPGGLYPGPRSTPTYHGGCTYYAAPDGQVGCLRADDGRPLWSVNVLTKFEGQGVDFGYACSPLVEDGKVILPVGGPTASVVALDARTGQTVWASGSQPASYSSALPIRVGQRRVVVAFLQNVLAGFDLTTGRQLWEQPYSQGYDEHAAMPLYDEPFLMTMLPFRAGSDLYEILPESVAANASLGADQAGLAIRLVRHSKEMSNDTASSVLVDGFVYGFDLREMQTSRHRPSRGVFQCIELKTGKVRWTSARPGHATVVVADRKLFLFNDKGELILARVNPNQYEELARTEIFRGEICWTAPSLHRGRLYLRSPTRAVCVYVGNPARIDAERLARAHPASTVLESRPLDLAWVIGGEREFPYDAPDARELIRWFLASLVGVLFVSAACGYLTARAWRRWSDGSRAGGWVVFWTTAIVWGCLATPLGNRLGDDFVFTWPVTLFAAHQLALAAILRSRRVPQPWAASWVSIGAVVFLLLTCLAYYDLCRRMTLALTWVFLMGFLPSWPLAIPAARRMIRPGHPAADLLWILAAFSWYFWVSVAWLALRTQWRV